MARGRTVLWRNLDEPGFERASISPLSEGWLITGTVLIAFPDLLEVRYQIECDPDWRTRMVHVDIDDGLAQRRLDLSVTGDGDWQADAAPVPQLNGSIDVDLSVSPVTNTLPIRRLHLAEGDSQSISVAWVRFPELVVERHEQHYERLAANVYRFSEGDFTADLEVDDLGLVVEYPHLWTRVASADLR